MSVKKEKRLSISSVLNRLNEEDETQYEIENEAAAALKQQNGKQQQNEQNEQDQNNSQNSVATRLFPILPYCNLNTLIDAKRRLENLEQVLINKFILTSGTNNGDDDDANVTNTKKKESLKSSPSSVAVAATKSSHSNELDATVLDLHNLCLNDECLKSFKYTNLVATTAASSSTGVKGGEETNTESLVDPALNETRLPLPKQDSIADNKEKTEEEKETALKANDDYLRLVESTQKVITVNLSRNDLRTLPGNLLDLFTNVQYLDLSENNLETIELINFMKFVKLKELKLNTNLISVFKAAMIVNNDDNNNNNSSKKASSAASENEYENLKKTSKATVDKEAEHYAKFNSNLFQSVERLSLANNKLRCVNCLIISQFRNLKYLNLSNNQFQLTPSASASSADTAGMMADAEPYQFPWQKPNSQLRNLIELDLSNNNNSNNNNNNGKKEQSKQQQQQSSSKTSQASVSVLNETSNKLSMMITKPTLTMSKFKTFHNLANLKILNISGNNLFNLPSDIKDLKYLEELYLDGNNLEFIPSELSDLRNLKCLSLNDNKLTEISENFCSYSRFKLVIAKLCLKKNQLKNQTLTNRLVLFENLKLLDLSENQFDQVPNGLPIYLEELNLNKNSIKTLMIRPLPPDAWQDEEMMTALRLNTNKVYEDSLYGGAVMNENNNNNKDNHHSNNNKLNESVEEQPDVDQKEEFTMPHVFYLRNLKRLYLADNYIADVPADFGILNSNLEIIDLSNNLLTQVTTSLCRGLGNLKQLNLSANKIRDLPDKVRELSELETLNLSKNRLASLNFELCSELKNLRELDLSFNCLEELPMFSSNKRRSSAKSAGKKRQSITSSAQLRRGRFTFSLISLKRIDLSNNRLNGCVSLYTAFSMSSSVEQINLSSNRLNAIDVENVDEAALIVELSQEPKDEIPNDDHMKSLATSSSIYKLLKLSSLNLSNNQMSFGRGGFMKLLCNLYKIAPNLRAFHYDQLTGSKLGVVVLVANEIKKEDEKKKQQQQQQSLKKNEKPSVPTQLAVVDQQSNEEYYFDMKDEKKENEKDDENNDNQKKKILNPYYDMLNERLEVIDLSNNALKRLPNFIYKLKSIKELYFNGNLLKKVPNEMYQFNKVVEQELFPAEQQQQVNNKKPVSAAANDDDEDEDEFEKPKKKKSKKKKAAEEAAEAARQLLEAAKAAAAAKAALEEQEPVIPISETLEIVEMKNNQLETVPDNLFAHFKSLREIKLLNNPLRDPPQESVCISARFARLERRSASSSAHKLRSRLINQSSQQKLPNNTTTATTTTITMLDSSSGSRSQRSSSAVGLSNLKETDLIINSRTESELNLPNLFYEANDNVKSLQSYMLKYKKREDLLLCNMFLVIKDSVDSLETLLKLMRRLKMPMDRVEAACKEIAESVTRNWSKIAAKEFAPEPGKMSLSRKELTLKMHQYILRTQAWHLLNYWRNSYATDAQSEELMRILKLMNSNQYENDLYEKLLTLKFNSNMLKI